MIFQSALSFILGLLLGSFLNMLIPRLHNGEKGIFLGRSHCSKCKIILKAQHLIPLLSYLGLKGRCHACKENISFWYPLTELSSGLLFLVTFLYLRDLQSFLLLLPCLLTLLFIFFYDLRYKEIHDAIMLPSIAYALGLSLITENLVNALIGGAIGFSFFGLQYWISKGHWLGSGDLRIGAFMGLFLAWPKILLALLVSYIIGSIISLILLALKKAGPQTAVPLGPFLVLGTVLVFFLGEQLLRLYTQLIFLS